MRVMIWVDMEGIAGIETWDQVMGGAPLYDEGRRLLTAETPAPATPAPTDQPVESDALVDPAPVEYVAPDTAAPAETPAEAQPQ